MLNSRQLNLLSGESVSTLLHVAQQLAFCFPIQELCFQPVYVALQLQLRPVPVLVLDARVPFLEDHFVALHRQPSGRHDREPAHHDITVGHHSCLLFDLIAHMFRTKVSDSVVHASTCCNTSFWITDHRVQVYLFLERHRVGDTVNRN